MNKEITDGSNNISTRFFVLGLFSIFLIVVGVYCFNFNSDFFRNGNWSGFFGNLSADNGKWGTFGDYIGGILNPVIAAFAFYLIAKTYELQKKKWRLQENF